MSLQKTQQIIKILTYGGWVSGVYLRTAEGMIASQEEWNEGDDSKNTDFTSAPFWIVTGDENGPIAMTSDRDLVKHFPELFCFKVNSQGLSFIQKTLKEKTYYYHAELHELQLWVDELECMGDEGSTLGAEMSSVHTKSRQTEFLILSNEHFSVEKINQGGN